jgi:hypothetical protein
VPEAVAKDPQAMQVRVRDTMALAEILKSMGHPQLIDALMPPQASNPVERWPREAGDALRKAEAGDRAGSNAALLRLLEEMKPASGPLVDDLRPKLLGSVGVNYFRLGDAAKARQYTLQALRECERTHDAEGVRNYRGNLAAMGGTESATDPAPPAGEADLLRLVLKAQGLCDQGEHEKSDAVLGPLLVPRPVPRARCPAGRILGSRLNAFRRAIWPRPACSRSRPATRARRSATPRASRSTGPTWTRSRKPSRLRIREGPARRAVGPLAGPRTPGTRSRTVWTLSDVERGPSCES